MVMPEETKASETTSEPPAEDEECGHRTSACAATGVDVSARTVETAQETERKDDEEEEEAVDVDKEDLVLHSSGEVFARATNKDQLVEDMDMMHQTFEAVSNSNLPACFVDQEDLTEYPYGLEPLPSDSRHYVRQTAPGSFAVRGPNSASTVYPSIPDPPLDRENTTTNDAPPSDFMVTATLVESTNSNSVFEQLRNSLRRSRTIENNSSHNEDLPVQAEADLVHAKPLHGVLINIRSPAGFALACFVLALVIIVAVLAAVLTRNDSNSSDAFSQTLPPGTPANSTAINPKTPTLQRVKESGVMRYGQLFKYRELFAASDNASSASQLSNQFGARLAQAIIVATGAKNATFQAVPVTEDNQYEMLRNGSVDYLLTVEKPTMANDVFQPRAGDGISYGLPWLYTGVGFVGVPKYVNCADDNINIFKNCSDLRICIRSDTGFTETLSERIPERQLLTFDDAIPMYRAFVAEECDVIASDSPVVAKVITEAFGFTAAIATGRKEYTTESHSVKTLDHDPRWTKFVDTVLWALFRAEQNGITSETAEKMGETNLFGEEYKTMLIDVIKVIGNFGDIYDLPPPRRDRNSANNGTTGLLMSPQLGDIEKELGVSSPKLKEILQRGVLRCAVRGDRPGFAVQNDTTLEWKGMDVDFCKALAASLFDGKAESVQFIDIGSGAELSIFGFMQLHLDEVDVFAGALWTIESVVQEPASKSGYDFTQPYFYGPTGVDANGSGNDSIFEQNLCLATKEEHPIWSAYVYWSAQSLIYAEEKRITQRTSSQMPLVRLFGPGLQRMFRDAVLAVGNYGEVYERHLSGILPRSGRNRLNQDEDNGPRQYLPPLSPPKE